jgi:hypothetical protein
MKSFQLKEFSTFLEQGEDGDVFGNAIVQTKDGMNIYFKFMSIDKLNDFMSNLHLLFVQWMSSELSKRSEKEKVC